MEEGGCLSWYVDTGSVESHRYFLARRTLLEMLWDRGYAIAVTDLELTLPAFRALYGDSPDPDRLRISSTLLADPAKNVLVIFLGTDKVKLATIRGIAMQVSKESVSRMILIIQSTMSSQARQAIKDIFKFKVEIFQITELLVNIMKHDLKPRHEILSAEDKQKLLKKYNVVENQLPRMLESDAVARYYGLDKGKVLKITYDGEHTGHHVTYRCVM